MFFFGAPWIVGEKNQTKTNRLLNLCMDDHRDPNSQLKAIEPTACCDLRIAGKISTTTKKRSFQRETISMEVYKWKRL